MDLNEVEPANYFDQTIMDFKHGSSRAEQRIPEVMKEYFAFTNSCFKEGTINAKHKQLIALAISISTQDEYCIIYHTKGAAEHGATEKEIMEVIGICAALKGGAAFSQGITLAMDSFDFYTQKAH